MTIRTPHRDELSDLLGFQVADTLDRLMLQIAHILDTACDAADDSDADQAMLPINVAEYLAFHTRLCAEMFRADEVGELDPLTADRAHELATERDAQEPFLTPSADGRRTPGPDQLSALLGFRVADTIDGVMLQIADILQSAYSEAERAGADHATIPIGVAAALDFYSRILAPRFRGPYGHSVMPRAD